MELPNAALLVQHLKVLSVNGPGWLPMLLKPTSWRSTRLVFGEFEKPLILSIPMRML